MPPSCQEMEACVGSRGGQRKCSDALQAQRVATASQAGTTSPVISVLWLTHSESMSPAQQCAEVRALQQQVVRGRD